MHLASKFLVSAIENADRDTARGFFKGVSEKFAAIAKRDGWGAPIDLARLSELLERSSSHQGRVPGCGLLSTRARLPVFEDFDEHEPRLLLILAEASLRLAALFHDLGHLPLSHDFEFALQDYVSDSNVDEQLKQLCADKPHEEIGHKIAKVVLQGIVQLDRAGSDVHYVVFRMATEILDEKEDHSALGWLHSLVDGELDVDRADYLLRDGRALGLDFAAYDIERLARNVRLTYTDLGGYETTVFERGLTSLESYVLSRCRSNRVLTRHHKSAQVAAAFRYCSAAALRDGAASDFLDCLRRIATGGTDANASAALLTEFARYSDGWWMEKLRAFRAKVHDRREANIADRRTRGGGSSPPSDRSAEILLACLDLILDRGRTLKSVWKREGDLNHDLVGRLNSAVDGLMKPEKQALPRFLKALREDANPVLAVVHRFTPFKFAKDPDTLEMRHGVAKFCVSRGDTTIVPMTELSPLVGSLVRDWEAGLHVHAFVLKQDTRTREQIAELIIKTAQSVVGT
jgi:HD superfamily phosphohydrolase